MDPAFETEMVSISAAVRAPFPLVRKCDPVYHQFGGRLRVSAVDCGISKCILVIPADVGKTHVKKKKKAQLMFFSFLVMF